MSLSFSHSGDSGDVIFGLSFIKSIGGGSLYLSQSRATRELMTETRASFLMPLIEAQSYIDKCEMYRGQQIAYDLDYFRDYWFEKKKGDTNYDGTTLLDWYYLAFDVPLPDMTKPWLTAGNAYSAPVIINRTERYHGVHFDWKRVVEKYKLDAMFVGLPDEHDKFCTEFGFIPHRLVKDALELANVINSCRLFIGNASLPDAIAEGLKKPRIHEVPALPPTCLFARPGTQYVISKNIWLPDVGDPKITVEQHLRR